MIEIPVLDSRERFTWGVWSSLSEKNYDFVREHWDDPSIGDMAPMFSWLSTWLPQAVYPSTIHLASQLFFRPGLRPLVVLESTDHPLSVEQVQGMSADRARAISALLLH